MSSRRYRFIQLDVFTDRALTGNQLAVFPEAEGLTDGEMQAIAREMNYSESTFVLPATDQTALCRVRIFTPVSELPFAGHPVVGTTFALAHEGRITSGPDGTTQVRLQLGVGTLPVDVTFAEGRACFVWMHQPVPTLTDWQGDHGQLAAALGLVPDDLATDHLPVQRGSAGGPFAYVPVRSLAAAGRARPMPELAAVLDASDCQGAYVFTLETSAPEVTGHSRMFAPKIGVAEDPATGSAAGPFGAYLLRHGRISADASGVAQAIVEQGVEMGRPSRLAVEVIGTPEAIQSVRVGGMSVVVAEGVLLPDAS